MWVYVSYEKKHPHLPNAFAYSAGEMADILGITVESVYASVSRKRYIRKVWIDD